MFVPTSFFQACWVVPDLERAMRRWAATAQVGPFFVNAHVKPDNRRYRGQPTEFDHSVALAQAGPLQIELIAQHDDKPSVYRDSVPASAEGFHHMAVFVDDIDADIARYQSQGAVLAYDGIYGDMRFAYLDTRAELGFMVELLEKKSGIIQAFKNIADAAIAWDGSDPIRPFPTG